MRSAWLSSLPAGCEEPCGVLITTFKGSIMYRVLVMWLEKLGPAVRVQRFRVKSLNLLGSMV